MLLSMLSYLSRQETVRHMTLSRAVFRTVSRKVAPLLQGTSVVERGREAPLASECDEGSVARTEGICEVKG